MPKFNRLFIAEKASVGKSLAEYLAKTSGHKAHITGVYAQVGNDYITWMSGHLLELVDAEHYNAAYAKWRLEDLPIIPSPFVLAPKSDPRSKAAEKIGTIKKMLADCTTVVGYGDPDAEGQLIQDELLIYLGNKKPVLRLWSNALDDASYAKALSSMKPNDDYIGWYESALARSHADWLYGINMTRACALHAQAAGAGFKITVGRVQTPTLNLVVERELAIRNFKAIDYYVPFIGLASDPRFKATWLCVKNAAGEYEDPRVDLEGRILQKSDSDTIVQQCKQAGTAQVLHTKTTAGTEAAPLPFALSSLQAFCSRKYGLGASQTLEVAQSLYLKKLTSYPRVDCDYLPESQHGDAADIMASIAMASIPTAIGSAIRSAKPNLKSKAWNDSKVTAHHAIIPNHLDDPTEIGRLTDMELKIYFEIVKRYTLQFWPVAKFMDTEVVLSCGLPDKEEMFSAKGRRYTDEGWRKAFVIEMDDADPEDTQSPAAALLPSLTNGQVIKLFEAGADLKTTSPPKRFTDGTLVTAMKKIHLYVKNPEYKKRLKEGVGIGTEATRGEIIKSLGLKGFLITKGKEFIPSDGAIELMRALPDIMKTPDMTAMWQQLNDDVKERRATHADFIGKMVPWLTTLVNGSSAFFKASQFSRMATADPSKTKPAHKMTDKVCFGVMGQKGCGSPLKSIQGKFGPFFGCSNPECKKTFKDVDGEPVEKGQSVVGAQENNPKYACQGCNAGFLRLRARKDGTGNFWGCSNWMNGCKAIFNDLDGEPDLEGKTRSGGSGPGGPGGRPQMVVPTRRGVRPAPMRPPITPTPR
jgi:DNA topoisomerase-3